MKGQKIYVITAGEYSNYHICAVTTDPERAEKLRKFYFKESYDGAEIETYLDGDPEVGVIPQLRPIWQVKLSAGRKWDARIDTYTDQEFQNSFELTDPKYICDTCSIIFRAKIDAADEKHALKIAQDMFFKLMAEEIGL